MARQIASDSRSTPLWVALVSVLATCVVWILAFNYFLDRDQFRFDNNVRSTHKRIEERMIRQVNLVRAAKSMALVADNLTVEKFHTYVNSLEPGTNYLGMLGLGISLRLQPDEVRAAESRLRAQGFPEFKVYPPYNDIHAIVLLEPQTQRNRVAMGYNMFSDPVRRDAMSRARDSGDVALSGKVILKQEIDPEKQPGFLLYFPFYKTIQRPSTVEERRKQLAGFAYSPFRAKDLFTAIFEDQPNPFIRFEIYDGQELTPEHILYGPHKVAGFREHWAAQVPLETGGHVWTIVYHETPAFERGSGAGALLWIPLLGALVTALLTGLSWRQANTAASLRRQALELQRREFQQRMLAEAGSLLNESLDYERTLGAVAHLAVPGFADWCAVDVLAEDGSIRRLAIAHVNPEKITWADEIQRKYPPDPEAATGVPKVLRTGEAELYEHISDELLRAGSKDEEQYQLAKSIGFTSAMVVPMRSRGHMFGALTYVWAETGKSYDREDLQLAQEIADRAAVAMDNALLYQSAHREKVEVSRLNENLERMVRERTEDLETAIGELEAFSYSVSHDLRAPLRGVDGFSKSLLDDYGNLLDEDGKEHLRKIRAAAKRMDELITALLSLSRITRAELNCREVDLTRISQQIAEELKLHYPSVQVRIQEGLTANADPRMIPIALENLISNAVKFSSKVASPLVEVGKVDGVFFVRDNGVGYNPEYSSKLFAPFERLHSVKEFPGSGIGLATVQRIIHRHGGRVWAESQEGKGATFYFTL
jgi:signal transduction histidine kinase/CHASE1-domain containing sensor protein